MDDAPDGEKVPRTPTPEDLARVAAGLNAAKARYAVIGGFAMIHHGFQRGTADIDLLVDPSPENVERIREGLLASACGVTWLDVSPNTEIGVVAGVPVPYASARDLYRTKDTIRPRDAVDRQFLIINLFDGEAPG